MQPKCAAQCKISGGKSSGVTIFASGGIWRPQECKIDEDVLSLLPSQDADATEAADATDIADGVDVEFGMLLMLFLSLPLLSVMSCFLLCNCR